jgi:hypothetical protein
MTLDKEQRLAMLKSSIDMIWLCVEIRRFIEVLEPIQKPQESYAEDSYWSDWY